MTNSGATLGVPKITRIGGCINDGSVALLDVTYPLKLFLYYFLKSKTERLRNIRQGAAQPNLNTGIVKAIPVPLAPENEQSRIVAKIEELFSDLDAGVAALERAKANLKRYRAAVLKAAVEGTLTEEWRAENPPKEPASKLLERILKERRKKWEEDQLAAYKAKGKQPPKNWRDKYKEPAGPGANLPALPEGWYWATLDQLGRKITDGEHLSPTTISEGVFLLSAKDVRDHGVVLDDPKYVSAEDAARFRQRCDPECGDVLIVSRGATIGRTAIVQVQDTFCLMGSVILVKSFAQVDPRYLACCLRNRDGQKRLIGLSGSTAQQAIYIRDIRTFRVPLPPQDEQTEISEEVELRLSIVDEATRQIEADLKRATRLRQSILKRAFEGKLVPQDPTDTSASDLLASIQSRHDGLHRKKRPSMNRASEARRKR